LCLFLWNNNNNNNKKYNKMKKERKVFSILPPTRLLTHSLTQSLSR
ncbi:MAG: hypothetical protein ACI90V_012511, partial [Bacillariaceae sp.]